jgi:hypothetical protein
VIVSAHWERNDTATCLGCGHTEPVEIRVGLLVGVSICCVRDLRFRRTYLHRTDPSYRGVLVVERARQSEPLKGQLPT